MDREPQVIATRTNADGHRAVLWSDGVVSMQNVGRRKIGVDAGYLLFSELSLYTTAEFLRAARVAKRAVEQEWSAPLSYFRQIMSGKRLCLSMNAMGSVGAVSYREPDKRGALTGAS